MKIVTHNGHFHTDELMAVATLLSVFPDAEVVRSRSEEIIEAADIVVDVGLKYDPEKLRFDHHQHGGAGERANGVPYASFGLVWKEFGEKLSGGKEEAQVLDEKLVAPIDAADNGVPVSTPVFLDVIEYSIGDYFESFTEGQKTLEDLNSAFGVALEQAQGLLDREIRYAKRSIESAIEVRRAYENATDHRLVILEKGMSWKRALVPTEALMVVYPRPDGHWAVQCVPKTLHRYELKQYLPEAWAGLENHHLSEVTGVNDSIFCHRGRWLVVSKSKEGAIKLAELALNS